MIPIRRRLYQSQPGFTPRQLFSALQGAWLEPTLGWIFTDTAGTSAITTGGQAIARINDQSGYGYNASQSTAANRPLLGRRYNLLTYSEDFSNGAWVRSNCSVTSTTAIAPDGSLTAYTITATNSAAQIYQGSGSSVLLGRSLAAYYTIWVRRKTGSGVIRLKKPNGTGFTDISITDNWSVFTSATSLPYASPVEYYPGIYIATNGDEIDVWHPFLRFETLYGNVPDYQRITTASDYDYGQYPAAVHDTTDSLSVSLPNLGGGVFSNAGSVYFATPVGMSALHNQSMGTTFTLPALSTDIYSWVVVPQRLNTAQENRLERYMLRKARLAAPDYLTDDFGETITDDIGDPILAG